MILMKRPERRGGAFARKSDPATSHAAAGSLPPEAVTKLERIVYEAICSQGLRGATWDEVAKLTGLDKASISPRWKPLCRKKLIKELRDEYREVITRHGLRSNRGQTVWVAI